MYYLGIDLGGTNIAAGIVDSNYKIIKKDKTPTKAHRPIGDIMDDMAVLEFFAANSEKPSKEFAQNFLSNEEFFGQDLTKIDGLVDTIAGYLDEIAAKGMRKTLEELV